MPAAALPTSVDLDLHLAGAGRPAASFARLWHSLWTQPYVSAELLELCRLALARLHQDPHEISAHNRHVPPGSPSRERREAVLAGDAARSTAFSHAERTLLAFAESYALDPRSIGDELAAQVTTQLGEPGLVFFIEALGCLDGRMRSARCLRDLARLGGAGESHVR
jgi:hypothetical protein